MRSNRRLLDHLEADRGAAVATRNTRLAAVHSFFRFAALRHPEHTPGSSNGCSPFRPNGPTAAPSPI